MGTKTNPSKREQDRYLPTPPKLITIVYLSWQKQCEIIIILFFHTCEIEIDIRTFIRLIK